MRLIDLTINLKDNEIVGLNLRGLVIEGHEINIEMNLDRTRPEREVENSENYLEVMTLVESVVEYVEKFGVKIPETIEFNNTSELNIEDIVKDVLE